MTLLRCLQALLAVGPLAALLAGCGGGGAGEPSGDAGGDEPAGVETPDVEGPATVGDGDTVVVEDLDEGTPNP
jgi:hypothetical protein